MGVVCAAAHGMSGGGHVCGCVVGSWENRPLTVVWGVCLSGCHHLDAVQAVVCVVWGVWVLCGFFIVDASIWNAACAVAAGAPVVGCVVAFVCVVFCVILLL